MRKKPENYTAADILCRPVIEKNIELLQEIRRLVTTNQAALVIGAGMSIPAGLPAWNTLLAKCLGKLFALQEKGLMGNRAVLVRQGTSGDMGDLLTGTRPANESTLQPYEDTLLQLRGAHPSGFPDAYQAVIDALADGRGQIGAKTNLLEIGEYLRIDHNAVNALAAQRISELGVTGLVQQCTRTEKTISEIVCTPLGKLANLLQTKTSQGITEVVNYNFDTLFEACLEYLKGCGVKRRCQVYTSEKDGSSGAPPDVHIYHVHGLAPTYGYETNLHATPLIFTEDSYYSGEQDILFWPFRLQNELLMRKSCLLFGFSGQDYNFRRIAKIQKAHSCPGGGRKTHYLFMPVQDVLPEIDGLLDEGMDAGKQELCERLIVNFLCSQKAKYWSSYGIEIIWTSYADLGCMIDFLAGKTSLDELKAQLIPGCGTP